MKRSASLFPSLLPIGLLLCGLSACDKPSPAPDSEPAAPTVPSTSTPAPVEPREIAEVVPKADPESPPQEVLTLTALHPLIREESQEGLPPDRVVVEFSQAVVAGAKAKVGGTRLSFEPKIEGSLKFSGPSTLVFTPSQAWLPNTKYQVTLEALETRAGLVKAQASYARVFKTPRFGLVRVDIVGSAKEDGRRNRVDLELVFSGPVAAEAVKARLNVHSEGGASITAHLKATNRKHVVQARLHNHMFSRAIRLRVALARGLSMQGDSNRVAAAAQHMVQVPQGKIMTIYASHIEEGSNGFFVRLVCTDDAFSTKRMYYWDNITRNSWRVSQRCILDEEDARDSLHFSPPLKYTLSPTRGGFRILGDFARGTYSMRIDADARTADGGVLQSTYSTSFSVPARKPKISFLSQGRYLPREAWKNLGVRHMNTSEATLEVRRVSPANLVYWMTSGNEAATANNSDLVLKEKIRLKAKPDVMATSWVNVQRLMPDAPRGVLSVKLHHKNGVQASARLLVTDINLVAKHEAGTGKTRVWALDMHSNEPLRGVKVEQVVRSGRVISSCTSDGAAGCTLDGVSKDAVDQAKPFALIAQKGEDLTYLVYDELQATPDAARVHGRAFKTKVPYSAAVYADRGVYRPGETAHVVVIARDQAQVAPPAGMPLSIELVNPRGKVIKRYTEKVNSVGMVALDLQFAAYADTGRHTVKVSAGKKPMGKTVFNVEEFVPERMKVQAEPVKMDVLRTDSGSVKVDAQYLFGGSAEDSRFEIRCELAPAKFKPAKNGEYEYGAWQEKAPQPIALGSATGTLDEKGVGTLACPPLNGRGGFAGPARLDMNIAVFESGSGRTTQTQTKAWVHPAKYYVGLKSGMQKLKAGKTARVQGVVVDWKGELVTSEKSVRIRFYKLEREHDWVYDQRQGRWSYRQYSRLAKEGEQEVAVKNGKFKVDFAPGSNAAAFVVRAEVGTAQADLKIEGDRPYWWSWNASSGQDRTPRPLKPATVPVRVPSAVQVGETFSVTFTPPFKGRALVALETDEVVTYEWLEVDAKPTVWKTKLKKFAPNVYASVFVVKDPHLESKQAFLPNRGFAVRSIKVTPAAFIQPLTISAPKEVRSNSTLKVDLDFGALSGPMFVTVAAVDEGILQLTKYQSPDPFKAIFDKRGLGIKTYETIGWNLLLPAGGEGRTTGGDSDADGPGRVQPIKPVALWSGLLEVPKSGKLSVDFDVPQYRGALRVMAVAAGAKRMAKATAKVIVRDPLVLQTTLPRFLTFNDTAEVPVFVTNLSGARRAIKVRLATKALAVGGHVDATLKADDLVKVVGRVEQSLVLEDGKAGSVVFTLKAQRPVGAVTLNVVAESDDLRSEESLDIPLLPASPKSRKVRRIELKTGTTDLMPLLQGWLPTTEKSTFWVTNNPYGDAFDHLKYLVRYPHGCIEQTTSTTRPLLFVAQLMSSVDPSLMGGSRPEKMVMHGVNRVLSMQTPEGGFSYWPGGREPVPWGTAYALHMLLDAQKLRYPVPQERINDALEWVQRVLSQRYTGGGRRSHYYGRPSEAYLHYVLAKAGRGRKARILKVLDEVKADSSYRYGGQRAEDVYMLQAALYMAGDHRFEKELRHPDTSPLKADRHNSWSFYSDRRRRGFMLSTYADIFGASPEIEPLAALVAEGLRGHRSGWYTTQELVWGITGLGKHVGELTKGFKPAQLIANGKSISAESVQVKSANNKKKDKSDSGERTWSVYRASEYRSLALKIDKAPEQRVFLIASSEGVRQDAKFVSGGSGLALTRTYKDASGEPIKLSSVALGDVVYGVVEITNKSGERMQNIAIVDRFAAGLEVENPRLSRGGGAISWIAKDALWTVDYMNLRDDRVELFGSLKRGQTRTFVYALRAVTAGTFAMPPVEAEAMYDPSRWARALGTKLTIRGPWASQPGN